MPAARSAATALSARPASSPAAPASSCCPTPRQRSGWPTNPVFKAMPAPWQPRWRAWLTGFDGTAKLAGDAATGSAALSHNVGGLAGGLDYPWAPDMLL